MARMTNVLAAARGIVTEDDYDAVSAMLDASRFKDKATLSGSLEDMFGWDPLTHHDRLYLEDAFKDIVSKAPDSMKQTLTGLKDEIIDSTLASKQNTDEEYLYQLLIANVAAETGWTCKEEVVDMTSTIYDEVCGPNYAPEDDEDVGDDPEDLEADDEPMPYEQDEEPDDDDIGLTVF